MSLPNCYRCHQPVSPRGECGCADGICLVHGDARAVLPLLEKGSVRLLWTDPPYGHGNQDGDLQSARVRDNVKGARKRDCQPIANDSPEEMRTLVDTALVLAVPILAADCCCCCCCGGGGPKPTFAWTATRMDEKGLDFFHAVVWDKSDRGNGLGWRFRRNYEFVMVAHRSGGRLAWADDTLAVPNILRVPPPTLRQHPNQKPVELVRAFMQWTTQPGDFILDPFAGSGTTGRAAKDLGRRCLMVEIEEKYCLIAAARLRQEVLAFTT
jgi:DNA modification methylase